MDPALVEARWRPAVAAALDARSRYREVAVRAPAGPVHDRLAELGAHVDTAVLAAWDAARRGADLAATVATLDPDRVNAELKAARRRRDEAGDDPAAAELVASLATQHAAAQRLWNELDAVDDRLRLVEVRLGALVARAAELAWRQGPTAELDAAGADLDAVVGELGRVRAALDELDAGPG